MREAWDASAVYEVEFMMLITSESITPTAVGREEWATGLSVLHVEGPLRAPVSRVLRRRVEGLLARDRRRILLDLAKVTDLDAAGLGELVGVYTLAGAADGALWVRNTTRRMRRLLEVAGLLEVLGEPSPFAWERCS